MKQDYDVYDLFVDYTIQEVIFEMEYFNELPDIEFETLNREEWLSLIYSWFNENLYRIYDSYKNDHS